MTEAEKLALAMEGLERIIQFIDAVQPTKTSKEMTSIQIEASALLTRLQGGDPWTTPPNP